MHEVLSAMPRDSYRLIVDSGAFTAWNLNKEISMKGYCDFLGSIKDLAPFKAVQLDVFGDHKQSWANYLHMVDEGLDVMPVFTRGESMERAEEMYSYTDYIMFGGVTIGRGNGQYVKWFLERNKGRKAHWLGFVNLPFIKHYKPESVDASSWMSACRFGRVDLYAGGGQMKKYGPMDFIKPLTKEMKELCLINHITPSELSMLRYKESWKANWKHDGNLDTQKKDKRSTAQFIGTLANIIRAKEIEKKLGTKVYLACSLSLQIEFINQANKFLNDRGYY